jgi:hypothetical protein
MASRAHAGAALAVLLAAACVHPAAAVCSLSDFTQNPGAAFVRGAVPIPFAEYGGLDNCCDACLLRPECTWALPRVVIVHLPPLPVY